MSDRPPPGQRDLRASKTFPPVPIGPTRFAIRAKAGSSIDMAIGVFVKPPPLVPKSTGVQLASPSSRVQVLMAKHEVVKRDTKVPDGPPRPPPILVAKAMPKQRLKAQSFITSIMPDVHCLYFSIVAIQPYEPAAGEEHIREIRNHYLDDGYQM